MWLLLPLAFPCDDDPGISGWIPAEGPVRQGTWLRVKTDAAYPSAELSEARGGVYQLEERLADKDRPDGWLGWQVPEDLIDDDWTLTVYDDDDELGSLDVAVREDAQVGTLEDTEQITWITFDVTPSEEHPDLCDTGLDAAYHRVTAVVDVPSAPANGWLVEIRESGKEPAAWAEMPRFGGTVTLSYLLHWTAGRACPEVVLEDGFGVEQAFTERGCVELPDLIDSAEEVNRREVCGCASSSLGGPWALVLLALVFRERLRRGAGPLGPRGAERQPPSDRWRP
ncbi:MAG: hypothetical protein GY913_12480 [Proteobacteria bacterium]|nr:hypothetical protein [Pseudomonadota bacterium]MCP4917733.1 hypothetical protein [Pseudomonadota bacterium]